MSDLTKRLREIESSVSTIHSLIECIPYLCTIIDLQREALEFYGEKANYERIAVDSYSDVIGIKEEEYGKIARTSLSESAELERGALEKLK